MTRAYPEGEETGEKREEKHKTVWENLRSAAKNTPLTYSDLYVWRVIENRKVSRRKRE